MSASRLTFYSNPQSRAAVIHWMLEELGEPYETVYLNYQGDMKTPEYLAINPMGKVPAIVHDGHVVTEGAAICAFLADQYPQKNLAPAIDSPMRGTYYRWLFFAAGPLEEAVTMKSLDMPIPADKSAMLGFGTLERTVDVLEQAISSTTWICGEQFTAADVYVGSAIRFYMQFGVLQGRPAFKAYVDRLTQRAAYQRSVKIMEQATAQLQR
ncbi:glutathione S-transferase [Advenella sp. S44]|uniref:glutathione S-transferase family protein n=1 Tax=Advenella sp. S44 TaxID=1982755 RepID=UPI000C2A0DE5|nr:glutathione S-transferase family protein [Advenella sp. S44]PJX27836.1 glutathione S-transferase [Advenella sp. S44]